MGERIIPTIQMVSLEPDKLSNDEIDQYYYVIFSQIDTRTGTFTNYVSQKCTETFPNESFIFKNGTYCPNYDDWQKMQL